MADDAILKELAELREQLDALKAAREADAVEPESMDEADLDGRPSETSAGDDGLLADVSAHVNDIMDNLDKDLKGTSPSTLLMVFAVGILVGRLLPR